MTTTDVLKLANVIALLAAIAALTIAVIGLSDVSAARRTSAYNTCTLIKGLILTSIEHSPQKAAALSYIHNTPLNNCATYANEIAR